MDDFRGKRYRVFHDIVGDGFNINHVIIGSAGVFTIETKTIGKPVQGKAETICDGNTVKINGSKPDRNPIVQGKAQASSLRILIKESTDKDYRVQPIILYPGWFIRSQIKSEVMVLNPKVLPAILAKFQIKLRADKIHLIKYYLSRYIQTREKNES